MKIIHLLLVDDNEGDILLAIEVFSQSQYSVKISIVNDGEDALDFVFKQGKHVLAESPDIILLDINMPKLNGIQVLEVLKKNEITMHIPIAVFSTSASNKDIRASYQKHANCYIVKPIGYSEYAEALSVFETFWFKKSASLLEVN